MNTFPLIALCLAALTCAFATADPLETNNDLFSSSQIDNECTFGPTFWCLNATTARLCDKYQYCKNTVWPKQLSTVKGPLCQPCKNVVSFAKQMLASKTNQDMVQNIIEKVCSLLPNQIFTQGCMTASKMIPHTMDLIGRVIDPELTCFMFCILDVDNSPADFQITPSKVQEEVYRSIEKNTYRLGRNPFVYI